MPLDRYLIDRVLGPFQVKGGFFRFEISARLADQPAHGFLFSTLSALKASVCERAAACDLPVVIGSRETKYGDELITVSLLGNEPAFIIGQVGTLTTYLEYVPYHNCYAWLAALPGLATVFTEQDARRIVRDWPDGEVLADPLGRLAVSLGGGRAVGTAEPSGISSAALDHGADATTAPIRSRVAVLDPTGANRCLRCDSYHSDTVRCEDEWS